MKRQPTKAELALQRAREANANRAIDSHARGELVREPVRTSFDAVFPGMPPALKLSA